jgi:hypothetical protein
MEVRKAIYAGCVAEWASKRPPPPPPPPGRSAAECGCGSDPESILEGLATLERVAQICNKPAAAKSCSATCAAARMDIRAASYAGCVAA